MFILRPRGGEDGPYTEEQVMDGLAAGDLSPTDWCRLEDQPQAQMLREVFEIEEEAGEQGEEGEEAGEGGDSEDEDEDDSEDEGEAIVYAGSPSLLGYGWTMAVAGGVLAAGYWLGRFGVPWVVGALGIALVLIVRLLLHRAAREYVVTTERVVSTIGLVTRTSREIPLGELASIRLHKAGPFGWLGVGTLIFSAEDAEMGDVVFERVGRVNRVIELIRAGRGRGGGG
ncbi:MAG: PH domain-containing protein [Verrucomicrobiales bacterium]